ncbi:DivIVA domain-containing protein [Desulfurivibrio alkaliphilus]|uniref:DivIVA domain protein n=1 Tax=Desulfurivibrio alkaliphilus (strain DSM 19089 / UNIQEM U267 / AHT2) TaxID=589865 RepID=D6Z4U5_DESAT|nr:DivIVA domain-containing protein [Desulfurivibrio alkaliphilus]ADH86570.1 DivIVA domain protein [Desulfurivibrio alkaliphilus AHT 2]
MLDHQDIQNQQFHVRFRGFDTEEVDDFLEQVAATVQKLSEENKELKERLEAAERRVAAYKRQEKSSMSAILSAQNVAQEMKEKAREEAREVLAKARQEAKELEESASREISDLERELDRLRAIKDQVKDEVRGVLESYLSKLDAEPAGRPAAPSRDTTAEPKAAVADKPAPAVGPAVAAGAAAAATGTSDLYQHIELTDDMLPPLKEDAPAAGEPEVIEDLSTEDFTPEDLTGDDLPTTGIFETGAGEEVSSDNGTTLPDLDGDLVFSLEDPLDDEEESGQEAGDQGLEPMISLEDEPEQSPQKP